MKIKRFNDDFNPKELSAENGWINVKIDKYMFIRMSRYIPALDKLVKPIDKYNMFEKVKQLSNINSNNLTLQDKISIIIILQYLKEIKNNFNSSSAGFLIEGFLATLIYGKLTDEFSHVDLISKPYDDITPVNFMAKPDNSATGKTYQIKLYQYAEDGVIKLSWNEENKCDYYVICLKNNENNIDVYILDGRDNSINNYVQRNRKNQNNIERAEKKMIQLSREESRFVKTSKDGKDYIVIKMLLLKNFPNKIALEISGIENIISDCAESLQRNLKEMFDKLSDVHYDIDTLITGVDKNRNPVIVDDAGKKCTKSISELSDKVTELTKNMSNL